ncbi:MAG: 23S rRNA (adenine(2030)-N(6))-methyltransferase RlmJ, partial [Pseudomonadota bacterium]|nr:23S rRNA (adenine(2030)-N(6))-methyltransferase RlmJ [Pseudomonadota bacterium]
LLAHALREQDRIAACELIPEEAEQLKANFARDERVAVHARDGYAAIRALLPPKLIKAGGEEFRFSRGIVLIDPPYEAQLDEFDHIIAAVREALSRWPQAAYAVWYPIKRRRSLQPFFRRAATLPAKSSLLVELLVHPDDSPLRMNGSGMLLLNAPWQFDTILAPALAKLAGVLGESPAATSRVEWLKQPA